MISETESGEEKEPTLQTREMIVTTKRAIANAFSQLTQHEFYCCKALYTNPYAIGARQVQYQIAMMRMIEAGHKVPEAYTPIVALIEIARQKDIEIPSYTTVVGLLDELSKGVLVNKRAVNEFEKIRSDSVYSLRPIAREYAKALNIFKFKEEVV